jgi:hypothetical protein
MDVKESEEFISDIAVDDAKRTLLTTRYDILQKIKTETGNLSQISSI